MRTVKVKAKMIDKEVEFKPVDKRYQMPIPSFGSPVVNNLVLDAADVKNKYKLLNKFDSKKAFDEIDYIGFLFIPFDYSKQFDDWYGNKITPDLISNSKRKYVRAKVLSINTAYNRITYCYHDEEHNTVPIMEHSYIGFRMKGDFLHLHLKVRKRS